MMEINTEVNCTICNEINGEFHPFGDLQYNYLIKKKLNIIWSNEFFTIVPSIGPLNEGHLLIVPNNHIFSFHFLNLKQRHSLSEIKNKLRVYNSQIFRQDTEFFEHGTGTTSNNCGSCIVHAHLHALPVPFSINKYVNELKMWKTSSDEIYTNKNVKIGYLLIEDVTEQTWFNNKTIYESQILRKYYSQKILRKKEWNWRKSPNIIDVIKVINNYKDFK